jgi:hypothetical protein
MGYVSLIFLFEFVFYSHTVAIHLFYDTPRSSPPTATKGLLLWYGIEPYSIIFQQLNDIGHQRHATTLKGNHLWVLTFIAKLKFCFTNFFLFFHTSFYLPFYSLKNF